MFAILARMALRWALAESEEGGTLFPDERVAERHLGKGAYAGMEFLHVNARTVINSCDAGDRVVSADAARSAVRNRNLPKRLPPGTLRE